MKVGSDSAPEAQDPSADSVSYARNVPRDSAAKVPIPVGGLVAGKYLVERVLGAGGMGVVVAAKQLQLDRKVAIKFLLPQALSNEEAAGRFKREARAMAKLQNEHVVRVLDVGTLETGEPYMVMEYLEGTDISRLIKEQGPLSIETTVDYVLQACEAMAEAHAVGIVHRDLKPSNIYLARRLDGKHVVKLLDFGIAKVATESAEAAQSFTTTTALLGSPVYMSPEQLQCSRDADARADIWSLGAIMHKMLAGRPPFLANTMPQVCTLIMSAAPQRIREARSDVPPQLEAVLLRCLEKRPDDRFKNVGELADALAPFAPPHALGSIERAKAVASALGGQSSIVPAGPSSNPSVSGSVRSNSMPSTYTNESGAAQRPSKVNRMIFALAAGIAVGSAATLWFALRSHPEPFHSTLPPLPSDQPPPVIAPPPLPPLDTQGPAAPNTGAVVQQPPKPVAPPVVSKAQPAAAVPAPRPRPRPPSPSGDNVEFGGRK